jgi:peptidoglycan/LPS O-acetylase OafA/YrhL
MTLKYYTNLDGTRGIAALMVVVFHFFYFTNYRYPIRIDLYRKFTELGQHGVSFFFVLSGFVITRILINTRNDSGFFGIFYSRRALRILPLYYFYLLFFYFIMPIILDSQFVDFKLQLPYYLYLQNFGELLDIRASGPGHYWSLAIEEHFYLIWPLVIFFVRPKYFWKTILISMVLILIIRYYLLSEGLPINHFTLTRIDQLIIGAVLSLLEYDGSLMNRKSKYYFLIIGLSIFPIAASVYYFSGYFYLLKELIKSTLMALFFMCILGYLISSEQSTTINKILSSKIMRHLGKISYGIYVWHVSVIFAFNKYVMTGFIVLDLLLIIGMSVIVAHISFTYVEDYFLKFRERIYRQVACSEVRQSVLRT